MIVSLLCYKNKINQFFYRNPNNTAAVDYQRRVSCTVPRLDGVALFFFVIFVFFTFGIFFRVVIVMGGFFWPSSFWLENMWDVLFWFGPKQVLHVISLALGTLLLNLDSPDFFFFSCQNPFSHFFCCLSFVHSTSPRSTVPRPYTQTSFPLQQH